MRHFSRCYYILFLFLSICIISYVKIVNFYLFLCACNNMRKYVCVKRCMRTMNGNNILKKLFISSGRDLTGAEKMGELKLKSIENKNMIFV